MPFPVFPTVFCSIEQYHIHLSITLSLLHKVGKDCLAGSSKTAGSFLLLPMSFVRGEAERVFSQIHSSCWNSVNQGYAGVKGVFPACADK
jgi:hypothetical protein